MPMREEFVKQGNKLFKRRSFFPFLSLPLIGLAFWDYTYPSGGQAVDMSWEIFCLLVSTLGLFLRVLVAGSAPKRTSGRNTRKGQVAHEVNQTGMYSIVRHPLYLANFVIALGWFLFFRQWWVAVTFTLLFWLYYERIMFAEEEFLRTMAQPGNLRTYHEKTRENIRHVYRWMMGIERALPVARIRLWSEGEENLEARLEEILAVR